MKIHTLKFSADRPEVMPMCTHLEFEKPGDFEWGIALNMPEAHLVKQQDLSILRGFKEIIVDRGTKDKRKGLSKYLLGLEKNKIPIIVGNYESSRQLKRSIRTLVERARNMGEYKLFVIATQEAIFDELWKKATEIHHDKGLQKPVRKRKIISAELEAAGPYPRLLFELMDHYEEPLELTRRYIGQSLEAQLVRQLILHAAQADTPVLILGNTGTGKELVAREIHRNSGRSSHNFIPVNCGAIPGELFESEVFGHLKGAFTGATSEKAGLWKMADKGTLFLDEIGDLHLNYQVKILRALEDGKIRPVGATQDLSVDARVIAATHRDLFSMVREGSFREDLYYRLRGFLIRTPSLNNHENDIPLLAQVLWRKTTNDDTSTLPQEIIDKLQTYSWPGNARELKSVLGLLRGLFGKKRLGSEHLEAIFSLEGHGSVGEKEGVSGKIVSRHPAECLRHLNRVDEAVHAAKATLHPVVERRKIDEQTVTYVEAALRFHLNEFEILCQDPSLFSSEFFAKVYGLKGKLTYFQSFLPQEIERAQTYWDEVAEEFKVVLSEILKEQKRLVGEASKRPHGFSEAESSVKRQGSS